MTDEIVRIPRSIQAAYCVIGARARHIPSNINETFVIEGALRQPPSLVLQRLHPVFGANVNQDIAAVTEHLSRHGLVTPRLLPSVSGSLWVHDEQGRPWRAQTFVEGLTFHRATSAAQIQSAAGLLALFHAALVDLTHEFVHQRPLHETARHLDALREALGSGQARGDAEAQSLGTEILRHAQTARTDFGELPQRTCHGDPKLSNVMFQADAPEQALCWLDLDTVGKGYLAYELGDAARSWCNPAGEDTASAALDVQLFRALISGYVRGSASTIEQEELLSVFDGVRSVSLELASRFARDVVEDRYFGWDAQRFSSRREHNLLRARGQLALSISIERQRPDLLRILAGAGIG